MTTESILIAFFLGFLSHAVLDILINQFMLFPLGKYWLWVVIQPVTLLIIILISPSVVIWGVIGAIMPDVLDGIIALLFTPEWKLNKIKGINESEIQGWMKSSRWNKGLLFLPFHKRGATISKQMISLEVNAILSALSLLGFLIARKE